MTHEKFMELLRARLDHVDYMLGEKAKQYAFNGDRLHNFKHSASLLRGTPPQAAWAFAVKHLTSIKDMVDGLYPASSEICAEKFTDAIAYLILIEACLLEKELERKESDRREGRLLEKDLGGITPHAPRTFQARCTEVNL